MMQTKRTANYDKSVSRALGLLIDLFMKRVAIRPVPEHFEEEDALKQYHAQGIIERYEELLGIETMVEIANKAIASIEESILHEIALKEQQELDLQLEDIFAASGHMNLQDSHLSTSPADYTHTIRLYRGTYSKNELLYSTDQSKDSGPSIFS